MTDGSWFWIWGVYIHHYHQHHFHLSWHVATLNSCDSEPIVCPPLQEQDGHGDDCDDGYDDHDDQDDYDGDQQESVSCDVDVR